MSTEVISHPTTKKGGQLAFSVDVEEHYMVLNFQARLPRDAWSAMPTRVGIGTGRVLELLARHNAKGTFFILGCVAEAQPELVRRIAAAGHEVASHGWSHTTVTALDRLSLFKELHRSKQLLEDLSGQEVIGFRAPSFSVRKDTLWALDVLLDAGYRYDSSIFPVRHPDYGIPDIERLPHRLKTPSDREIIEFPMTTAQAGPLTVPVSGGGYFRLLPYAVTRWGLRQAARRGRPAVFYLHPWELDEDQPDLRRYTSRVGAFRHYTGLKATMPRLERLLGEFSVQSMAGLLAELGLLSER